MRFRSLLDYLLVKHIDLYAAVAPSNVYGGLADGYWRPGISTRP
jgi:hypothetical protein